MYRKGRLTGIRLTILFLASLLKIASNPFLLILLVKTKHLEDLGAEGEINQVIEEIGETADCGDTDDEGRSRKALPPSSVCEFAVVFVMYGTEQELADDTQDVDSRDHNRAAGDNREDKTQRAVTCEVIGHTLLERADEDCHLGNETAKAGETERGHTGYDVADREVRHDLHHTAHLADVAGMGATVYHTDQGEEEGREKASA